MTETVKTFNAHLYQLGWNWQHPRIQGYLEVVAQGLKRENFQSINEVPEKYIQCLIKLMNLYQECIKMLKIVGLAWDSKEVQSIMQSWGHGDRMPLKGWKQLHEWLIDTCPF
ncbi:hypothetical protein FACHB389_35305 [Nostoc calcicola FACHB-389]|nr:hypothetical protein FACHB389_35305 [Nostoc calcicola FACHB-389]